MVFLVMDWYQNVDLTEVDKIYILIFTTDLTSLTDFKQIR